MPYFAVAAQAASEMAILIFSFCGAKRKNP
jgi:hypothetical protein